MVAYCLFNIRRLAQVPSAALRGEYGRSSRVRQNIPSRRRAGIRGKRVRNPEGARENRSGGRIRSQGTFRGGLPGLLHSRPVAGSAGGEFRRHCAGPRGLFKRVIGKDGGGYSFRIFFLCGSHSPRGCLLEGKNARAGGTRGIFPCARERGPSREIAALLARKKGISLF